MAHRPEIVNLVSERETAEKVRALGKFIEGASLEYRKEGIPVGPDGRIDMQAFKSIYPEVDSDEENVRGWMRTFHPEGESEDNDRLLSDGERLEMLIHAIMYKNLDSLFIVARASHFDDIHHKADNVLFDRKTGNPICAFDEVGVTSGSIYEDKQAAIRDRNVLNRGAMLKYGLTLSKGKVVPGPVKNIPIFYIALPQDRILKGIKEFVPEKGRQSEFEQKLFEYFIQAMTLQIQGVELYSGRLDPNLKNRLNEFKKTLAEFKSAKK